MKTSPGNTDPRTLCHTECFARKQDRGQSRMKLTDVLKFAVVALFFFFIHLSVNEHHSRAFFAALPLFAACAVLTTGLMCAVTDRPVSAIPRRAVFFLLIMCVILGVMGFVANAAAGARADNLLPSLVNGLSFFIILAVLLVVPRFQQEV